MFVAPFPRSSSRMCVCPTLTIVDDPQITPDTALELADESNAKKHRDHADEPASGR
jgi:hypothetical protein